MGTLEPQLLNSENILWSPMNNTRHYHRRSRKNVRSLRTIKTTFALFITCLGALHDHRGVVGKFKYHQAYFLEHQREIGGANCRDGELWLIERNDPGHSTRESSRSRPRKQYQVCVYREAARF